MREEATMNLTELETITPADHAAITDEALKPLSVQQLLRLRDLANRFACDPNRSDPHIGLAWGVVDERIVAELERRAGEPNAGAGLTALLAVLNERGLLKA